MSNPTWKRTQTATAMNSTDVWELSRPLPSSRGRGWDVLVELTRDWPSRYHGNGVGGTVVDREAPKAWSVYITGDDGEGATHTLRKGLTVPQAKRAAMTLLAAKNR